MFLAMFLLLVLEPARLLAAPQEFVKFSVRWAVPAVSSGSDRQAVCVVCMLARPLWLLVLTLLLLQWFRVPPVQSQETR